MVICDQCHSRPQGNLKNDQPVNKDNRMLTPGISRGAGRFFGFDQGLVEPA